MAPKASAMPVQNVKLDPSTKQAPCLNCNKSCEVPKGSSGKVFCSIECYEEWNRKLDND